MIGEFADSVGVATPMLDRAVRALRQVHGDGIWGEGLAAMVDVIGALPRAKARD